MTDNGWSSLASNTLKTKQSLRASSRHSCDCQHAHRANALPVYAEASAQSYGEEGEEGVDNGAGGAPLSERASDELPAGRAQRMPSRRSSELGKRERRKRRLDDADEDDLNSLDEPLEGKKKRRGGNDSPDMLSSYLFCFHSASVRCADAA